MELQSELRMESTRRARPIEVMSGPTGRRRWPDALKARVVAETLQPGSRVRDVASRYGLLPHHLSAWRSMARKGTLVLAEADMPAFVPVTLQDNADRGGSVHLNSPARLLSGAAAGFMPLREAAG